MKLLTSQKNLIFELIQENDYFSHNQFELIESETMGEHHTRIQFKSNQSYYFKFLGSEYVNAFYANYSPGHFQILDYTSHIPWREIIENFEQWLSNLRREIAAPNLWDKFKENISEIKYFNDFDNQNFSYSEYSTIIQKIDILKNSLSSVPLILDQQKEIFKKLDHLCDKAKDLGKSDWINLFVGTIISVIIQLNVTNENANAIWNLIKNVFNNYFLPN